MESAVVARVAVVHDRDLHVDRHATEGVDDLLEAVEVDRDVVIDLQAVEVAERRFQGVETALRLVAGEEVGP